jgi:hypothetical protein
MVYQKGVHVDDHERVKDLNAEPARQQVATALIRLSYEVMAGVSLDCNDK